MIKLENYEVVGWEHAIRGMRNPMNSWEKMDSKDCRTQCDTCDGCKYYDNPDLLSDDERCPGIEYYAGNSNMCGYIGPNDHQLMMKLANGGPVHAKYRRMITVYVDITAPLYWWKEFDTYKVGTVANSCSTMHKIHEKEFTLEDFSCEHLVSGWTSEDANGEFVILPGPAECLENTVIMLNRVREAYLKTKTKPMKDDAARKELMKKYWWQMIQLLPSSYNQKRTVMLNYEVLVGIYKWRKDHKLDEWREFCKWIESLPYSEIITGHNKPDFTNHDGSHDYD